MKRDGTEPLNNPDPKNWVWQPASKLTVKNWKPKMTDHPHIRRSWTCPCCNRDKPEGLVVCWQCHNGLTDEFNGGYGRAAETLIAEREGYLRQKALFRRGT